MRVMQILALTLFSFLFHSHVFGIAIVYNGSGCLNTVNANDPAPNNTPVLSKFEVIEDVGGGVFRLSLTGGIPRFVNNTQTVCIDSATAIGYFGINGLPTPLESIDATAYFSGQDLVIVVSSLLTDLSAGREPFLSFFSTSNIFAITNTLIFKFNPQVSSFRLNKVIHNRGYIHTRSGSTNSIPFMETVLPSFNEFPQDKPRILTPTSNIEYRLE